MFLKNREIVLSVCVFLSCIESLQYVGAAEVNKDKEIASSKSLEFYERKSFGPKGLETF